SALPPVSATRQRFAHPEVLNSYLDRSLVLEKLEHLLEPLNMPLGFAVMLLESGPEVFRLGCLCHFGQGGEDFPFGIIDVLTSSTDPRDFSLRAPHPCTGIPGP